MATSGGGIIYPAPPIIAVERAAKQYAAPGRQAFHALRDASLCVAQGEFVAITGKSGSGKSTLLNLIAGLDRPTSGTIRVGGTDLRTLGEGALAAWRGRTVGIVFQSFALLPTLTIAENVMLAMEFVGEIPRSARAERSLALLNQVGLSNHAAKLPSMLSGGEQQRAAIARALANDPPIVVADEPTGNLDSETADTVSALFAQLAAQGKTVLIVTHDEGLAGAARRRIRLKDGIVDGGSPLPAAA